MKFLVGNSLWNVGGFAFLIASQFLTIPLVIQSIGMEGFGFASLLIAASAPFVLVGAVLGQSLLRELSRHHDARELKRGSEVFFSALATCLFACVPVCLLFHFLGQIGSKFLPEAYAVEASTLQSTVAILSVGWVVQQLGTICQYAVAGTQTYKLIVIATILTSGGNIAFILLALKLSATPIGYIAGYSGGFLFALVVWLLIIALRLKWLFSSLRIAKNDVLTLIRMARWLALSQFLLTLSLQADRYVLGVVASPAAVGYYNVAWRLQEVINMVIAKCTEVVLPQFSIRSDGPREQTLLFFTVSAWLLQSVAVCALAPIVPLAHAIIFLWIGPEAATNASPILQVLAIAGIFGASGSAYTYFAVGSGRAQRLVYLSIGYSAIALFSAVLLVGSMGLAAAGVGFLLASLFRSFLVVRMVKQEFGSEAGHYVYSVYPVFVPALIGTVLSLTFDYWNFLNPSGWVGLALDFAMLSIIAAACILLALTSASEGRRAIRSLVIDVLASRAVRT